MDDFLLEAVETVLTGAEYKLNLDAFLHTHCFLFMGEEVGGEGASSFHHGHHECYEEFERLRETIVSSAISELGCTQEAFVAACEGALKGSNRAKSAATRKLLDMLLYVDDFRVRAYKLSASHWYWPN